MSELERTNLKNIPEAAGIVLPVILLSVIHATTNTDYFTDYSVDFPVKADAATGTEALPATCENFVVAAALRPFASVTSFGLI